MATVPSPRTWVVGELLTAAKLNTDLRDGLNFLLSGKPLASLYRTAGYNMTYGLAIPWDTESIDRDNGHSTVSNQHRYTAQTAGWYSVTCFLEVNDSTVANQYRFLVVRHDNSGGTIQNSGGASSVSLGALANGTRLTATLLTNMAVSDFVTAYLGFSESPSTLSMGVGAFSTRFMIEWISA